MEIRFELIPKMSVIIIIISFARSHKKKFVHFIRTFSTAYCGLKTKQEQQNKRRCLQLNNMNYMITIGYITKFTSVQ